MQAHGFYNNSPHKKPRVQNLAPCRQSQPSASCRREGQGTEFQKPEQTKPSTTSKDSQPSINPQCPFSPHPTRCRLTPHLLCNVPESRTVGLSRTETSPLDAAAICEFTRHNVALTTCDSRGQTGRKITPPSFFSPVIASPCQGDVATHDCTVPLVQTCSRPVVPVWPKTKLSGRNSCPKGPARTLSMVPGGFFKAGQFRVMPAAAIRSLLLVS